MIFDWMVVEFNALDLFLLKALFYWASSELNKICRIPYFSFFVRQTRGLRSKRADTSVKKKPQSEKKSLHIHMEKVAHHARDQFLDS